ncbi:MAG: PEP/pyruvate-binding domain-containing protein [Sedimentisphaerales bacterium]|nr:PEP/pyruvate-binding domain-containing protein [Sedimentisphaerales bacterium]
MPQQRNQKLSTGHAGLDHIFRGVIPGDNIVWHVDAVEEYRFFLEPYIRFARDTEKNLTYFRFARHEPLLTADSGAQIHTLQPEKGFETFISDLHQIIKQNGRGGYYVFDCLSDLAEDWYSDQMLGNFFMLTCPYLFDIEAVAYFGLYRNYHSFQATDPIIDTAQVFCNVYRYQGDLYIYPVKVLQRYSPTMYMLHIWKNEDFSIVTHSATISEVLNSQNRTPLEPPTAIQGVWNRVLRQAEEVHIAQKSGENFEDEDRFLRRRLIGMMISRDPRISRMVETYFSLADLLAISKRIIGTGLIGGKAVGMLLARAILKSSDDRWRDVLEFHDSFYIGSDIFYTFLVRNGIWRERPKDPEFFLEGSERSRHRIIIGTFPEYIEKQLNDILDYFGQSPFIVRSSSLLEDNFGNAFAGKYDSVFCINQGPREKRIEDFKAAIRTVYASALSERALVYRAQRGLLDRDEQMSLLVQRVSGAFYDRLFIPQAAGVGFSYNPYAWSEEIDPEAGVLRLVFGLGTRAVNRSDDDYTRIVALNVPQKRPESSRGEVRQFTQHNIDVLDLEANQLVTTTFPEVLAKCEGLPKTIFASRDREIERYAREKGLKEASPWVLDFDNLLTRTEFVSDMRRMLRTLHEAYDYPVDIEFTCNFYSPEQYKINLLQCRPLQIKGGGDIPDPPAEIAAANLLVQAKGAVIGHSRVSRIDRFVYVVPRVYGDMPIKERHAVARLIGQLMHVPEFHQGKVIMLLGPGRWGTTTPSLGVPINFYEINTVSILCEIVTMRDDLVPDVSLGTHLFSELVEMDILYLALFPHKPDNVLNTEFFETAPNTLLEYLPEAQPFTEVLRVIDARRPLPHLNANAYRQKAVCYLNH